MKLRHRQNGFHLVELLVVLLVIGAVGFIGFKVLGNRDNKSAQSNSTSGTTSDGKGPIWEYNEQKLEWFVKSGRAPDCKEPFKFDMAPVDMSEVIAVGLPGAYRGYSYKAHGGFRLADNTNGMTEVRLPMDANFRGVTRYYEAVPGSPDEIQYIVDFENDCGIAFRFDHLLTLSPALQEWAEKTPMPQKNDSRRAPSTERISIPMKAGDVIATAVGFPKVRNYGFDFGVYDYRKTNEISKNKKWADIHAMYSAQTFHGVCWLPMLPGDGAAKAEAMAKDRNNYNSSKPFNLTSDYCRFAPHTTLDFNDGQPTDG